MKLPSLVLSQVPPIQGDIENTLSQANGWKESLQSTQAEIVLELPVRRAGREGWTPDNPPIERIDELLNRSKECDCRFGSLLIPIDLTLSENHLGAEISAIDGWADLASYAEIRLARFSLLNAEALNSSNGQNLLIDTIDYMTETEVSVSIYACETERPFLLKFMDRIGSDPDRRCGLDLRLNAECLDGIKLPDTRVTTVSIPIPEPFSSESIQHLYEKTISRFGDSIDAVVFELE